MFLFYITSVSNGFMFLYHFMTSWFEVLWESAF